MRVLRTCSGQLCCGPSLTILRARYPSSQSVSEAAANTAVDTAAEWGELQNQAAQRGEGDKKIREPQQLWQRAVGSLGAGQRTGAARVCSSCICALCVVEPCRSMATRTVLARGYACSGRGSGAALRAGVAPDVDVGVDYVPHMSTGIAATRPNVRMVGSVMIAFSLLLASPPLLLCPDDVDALRPLAARSTSGVPPCCSRSGKLEYIAHDDCRLNKEMFQANLCVLLRKPKQRVETCNEDGCSDAAKRVHILVIRRAVCI